MTVNKSLCLGIVPFIVREVCLFINAKTETLHICLFVILTSLMPCHVKNFRPQLKFQYVNYLIKCTVPAGLIAYLLFHTLHLSESVTQTLPCLIPWPCWTLTSSQDNHGLESVFPLWYSQILHDMLLRFHSIIFPVSFPIIVAWSVSIFKKSLYFSRKLS